MKKNIRMNKIFQQDNVKQLIERLRGVERQGWVDRDVKDCETVYDHTMSLIKLVDIWKDRLSINDTELLKDMLLVHDLPEISRGDENIYTDVSNYKSNKARKRELERHAMAALCSQIGSDGVILFNLYDRYEKCETHDTQMGHELDKVQAVEQAVTYERAGYAVLAKDFTETYINLGLITHPALVEHVKHISKSK